MIFSLIVCKTNRKKDDYDEYWCHVINCAEIILTDCNTTSLQIIYDNPIPCIIAYGVLTLF